MNLKMNNKSLYNIDKAIEELDRLLLDSSNKYQSVLVSKLATSIDGTCVGKWLSKHKEFEHITFLVNCHPSVIKNVLNDGIVENSKYGEFYFCDNELDYFKDVPILVIDHFDLTDDDARKNLIRLVKNREVISGSNGEIAHLDNLKMIVATSFEIGGTHFGYSLLSDEDINAFGDIIETKQI